MDRSFREKPSSVGKEPQTQRSGSKENSVGSRHVVVYANNHMCRNVSFLCQLHRIKKFLIKKNWPSENETLYLWHLQTLKAKEELFFFFLDKYLQAEKIYPTGPVSSMEGLT